MDVNQTPGKSPMTKLEAACEVYRSFGLTVVRAEDAVIGKTYSKIDETVVLGSPLGLLTSKDKDIYEFYEPARRDGLLPARSFTVKCAPGTMLYEQDAEKELQVLFSRTSRARDSCYTQ
jgi:hypothetical protein